MMKRNQHDLKPTDVSACTCANLRRAMRSVTQMYAAALQPSGLKATQFTLLATLSRRNDVPLSQLAEFLAMDRTTLTRNLKPLIAKDLVAAGADDDRRIRRISLTDDGHKALEAAMPHWQAVQSRLVDKLGHAPWQHMLDDLRSVVDAARGL